MTTLPHSRDGRRTTKPRPKPARSIRVVEQPGPDTDGWGLQITVGKESATYLVRFIPCELGDGILGLEVEKLGDDLATAEQRYHIAIDPKAGFRSCECRGFLRHNHCKHVDGIAKLVEVGALRPATDRPAYRSAGDYAANDPLGFEQHLEDVA